MYLKLIKMNWKNILLQVCISFLLFNALNSSAQTDTLSIDDLKVFKGQAQQMVGFFEYQQNILGDEEATLREKQIIISASYKKSFADSLVQIEDDLDPKRKFSIFKDIQDYLKDIDFFFKKAEFSYDIIDIKHAYNQKDELYFTVSTKRKLTATNLKGKKIENYQNRYFDMNYDTTTQGLKIVSVYTNNPEERTDWQSWWQNLPIVWKSYFKEKYSFADSLTANDRDILNKLTALDISGRTDIEDLKPLSFFKNLKELNASGSGIKDLMPLRMLKYLKSLNISHTQISDLSPLKYGSYIKILNISETPVKDISVLVNLERLEDFNMSSTSLTDLSVLKALPNLKMLDASKLKADFTVLQDVKKLQKLVLDSSNFSNTAFLYDHPDLAYVSMNSTLITDFKYLSSVAKLKEIHFEHTQVASLSGLEKLKSLKKIYCDYSKVSKTEALKLSRKRPDIVVVFESQELKQWWKNMDVNWRNYFVRTFKMPLNPKIEDLHRILKQTSVSIHNNKSLADLKPLSVFSDLKELDIENGNLKSLSGIESLQNLEKLIIIKSNVKDVKALAKLVHLKYIDLSNNELGDINALATCTVLEELRVQNCGLSQLPELKNLKNLRRVYADNNKIQDKNVQNFYKSHQAVLVVYKTIYLQNWWKDLPQVWRSYFNKTFDIALNASKEDLHKLIRTQEISLKNLAIKSLMPLKEFLQLKKLVLNNLKLSSLTTVASLNTIETLAIQKMPIDDIAPVYELPNLKNLIINSLAIHKLKWKSLTKIEHLDISGNKIRFIGGIKKLTKLKYLNISNTRVLSLFSLKKLGNLKELEAYNSSVPYIMIKQILKVFPNLQLTWY